MNAVVAVASLAAVAYAAPDNCQAANEFAFANAGDCRIVTVCKSLAANEGFVGNQGFSNEGFLGNEGFNNMGFVGNEGFVGNDVFANTGFLGNEGFLGNDAFANAGFLGNEGFANSGFLGNEGFANTGFLGNEGFANAGFLGNEGFVMAALCQSLLDCGAFDVEGAFGSCMTTGTSEVTSSPTGEVVCEEVFVGDGTCDEICNTAEFEYDGGDCPVPTTTSEDVATETN